MGPRITIVGGGSTHWTPRLLTDFANTPSLHDAEVSLVDIDQSSLGPMERIAKHIAATRGIGLTATATTDLPAGLDGTQYVITALSVGGFASMGHDIEIPARYGVRQPVGDSVGPGGIFRSLRSIPVMVEIARQVERHAPTALLLNVSNPLSAVCRAVTSQTATRCVGLCNELVGFQFAMSLIFDAAMHEVDPVVAGINHLPVVTALRIGERDGFALLREVLDHPEALEGQGIWMDPPEQSHWHKRDPSTPWSKADVVANSALKLEIFRHLGVLPGSADTHVSEFFPWFVTPSSDFGRDWGVHHYGMEGHRRDKADDEADAASLEAGGEIPPWASGELAAPLIDAVVRGKERTLPMNLPNTGQVTDVPRGSVVECMGIADANGVRARDVASAGPLGEHLRRVVASQELTVQAALQGDPDLVLQAMLADPVAGSLPWDQVNQMTRQMLDATAPWLPQFALDGAG
jgi:alpha-galactosidase